LEKLRYFILSDPDICRYVRVIALREEASKLIEFLRREGAIQIDKARLAGEREQRFIEEMLRILSKGERIYSEFMKRVEGEKVVKLEYLPSLEEIPKTLREIVEQLEHELNNIVLLEKRLDEVHHRLKFLTKLKRFLSVVHSQLGDVTVSSLNYEGEVLIIKTVEGSENVVSKFLSDLGSAVHLLVSANIDDRIIVTIAFISTVKDLVVSKMREHGVTELEIHYRGPVSEVLRKIDEEALSLQEELRLKNRIESIVLQNLDRLALLKLILENEYEKYRALQLAIATKHAFVIEGWVPGSVYNRFRYYLENELKLAVIESVEVSDEPPVELRNPKAFKPFELITKLYGYPSPREWDPTPILAYSFIAFYGIMLGDCGYGIAQILATRYILPKLVENPETETFRSLQKILYITGIVSTIIGLLTGSIFGFYPATLIPWLRAVVLMPNDLVKTMSILMGISLVIGFIHIIIAHTIAGAKNLRLGMRWAALNEFAIVMAMIFGGPYVLHLIGQIQLPETLAEYLFKPLTFLSLGLIILSKVKSVGSIGIMLWLFDLTGALGDVLSYLRLAGLAIATVVLAQVFDNIFGGIVASLPAMLGHPLGTVIGICIGIVFFVVAHIFNIAISVLGAFVHSLRLCMLEFSTKFYDGNGKPFTPLKVVLHRYVPLRR